MKKLLISILITLSAAYALAQNAVKNVIVEPYYISDANDATDTTGGKIEPGFTTYRIYIQLQPGCKLLGLYGDVTNTLKISSTSAFFNNIDYGKSFGKDFTKSNYSKNTVALDTWLTLGQTTKKAANTYFGVLKSQDNDGSFIGGENNDGGSAGIASGLLTNNNEATGIPITIADGMDTLVDVESNWSSHGFIDLISGEDSTIFGSVKSGTEFISNDAYLYNTGVMGVIPDSNQILVAQLTTKGEISFELNIQVFDPTADQSYRSFYVAQGSDTINEGTKTITWVSPFLKYPAACGCNDPTFLEFDKKYVCAIPDSCKTPVVLGCMDKTACNYNADANFNVQELCCYPGLCYDRDLSLACPSEDNIPMNLNVYPNPAQDLVTIIASTAIDEKEATYYVYNYFGEVILEKKLAAMNGNIYDELGISEYEHGIYLIRLFVGNKSDSRMFIKN